MITGVLTISLVLIVAASFVQELSKTTLLVVLIMLLNMQVIGVILLCLAALEDPFVDILDVSVGLSMIAVGKSLFLVCRHGVDADLPLGWVLLFQGIAFIGWLVMHHFT